MGKVKKAPTNNLEEISAATSSSYTFHPSRRELQEMGKSLRDKCPRAEHAVWQAPANRPDPPTTTPSLVGPRNNSRRTGSNA